MTTSASTSAAEWGALVVAVGRDRDRRAFEQLFVHYAPRVKGFLMRSGASPDLADDLAQETLVAVWQKAASFDPARASASTWIYTVARNLWVDACRRRKPLPVAEERYCGVGPREELMPSAGDGDRLWIEHFHDQVGTALAVLPREQFAALEMAYFQDVSHSGISRALQIPLGTVKSRLRLAIDALRKRLDGEVP